MLRKKKMIQYLPSKWPIKCIFNANIYSAFIENVSQMYNFKDNVDLQEWISFSVFMREDI